MPMVLVLAKISPVVLDAVRERPALVTQLFSGEAADVFTADIDALERAAADMTTRAWFDTAVNGTESLGYDEFTYGPAFALDVADVRAVAVGLVAEGWNSHEEPDTPADLPADLDATARSLGAAAGWSPDEFVTYGPMLAATWPRGSILRLVRAVGAAGNWDDVTVDRVLAAVGSAAVTPEPGPTGGLASFFAAAAREGKAVVGGVS